MKTLNDTLRDEFDTEIENEFSELIEQEGLDKGLLKAGFDKLLEFKKYEKPQQKKSHPGKTAFENLFINHFKMLEDDSK